ncbi:MAG: hypothetical protein WCO89_00080 [Syntrophus sp. (in: bacteria)]
MNGTKNALARVLYAIGHILDLAANIVLLIGVSASNLGNWLRRR